MIASVGAAIPGDQAGAAPKKADKAPPGDPPGNNGTVKISRTDPADDPNYDEKRNEPLGENCYFWLRFFDFDQGQLADVTFAAHPPTGGKDPVTDKGNGFGQPGDGIIISDDPAGGGQDEDAVLAYNLTDYVRDLNAHPQHGYHIKLTTTIRNADGSDVPGGVKHKVFWIKCTPPAAANQTASTLRIAKAQEGAPQQGQFEFDLNCTHSPLNRTFALKSGEKLDIPNVPAGTTCVVKETNSQNAQSTTITEDPVTGEASDGQVTTTAEKATIVTFKNVFPGTGSTPPPPNTDLRPAGDGGSPGTQVAGVSQTNPSPEPGTAVLGATETAPEAAATLPRTGGEPWPLTAAGLWALGAGGLALLAGRRRRQA
jgi:LPXTG-motif cell wall-anchored protein